MGKQGIIRYLAVVGMTMAIAGSVYPRAAGESAPDPADLVATHQAFLEWESGTWDARITVPDPLGGGDPQIASAGQVDRLGAGGG